MPIAVFDVATVARLLRCADTTVVDALRAGDLPGLKFGREWIVPAAALEQRLVEKALQSAAILRLAPQAQAVVVRGVTGRKRPPTLPSLDTATS